jgi:carbonic anhydrase/acetyltransferase-like protein (isoleucine patch superfamily)
MIEPRSPGRDCGESGRYVGLQAVDVCLTIGSDVWVGGGAIICPGVRIGSGSVIGNVATWANVGATARKGQVSAKS